MIYDQKQEKKGFLELMADHPVVAPCVYDCVSAKLLEDAGFEAMCLSGGELAASLVGVPDIGLVTQDELVFAVERIANCTTVPMIVDIDTGFGNELNLIRTCKRVAHAGAKAVHLEDQTFPKRCGHLKGKQVIPHEDYISKIRAATYALEGTGCILIARTDAYHTLGFDEAISRCNDAVDAGAQVSFIEGCGSLADIEEAGRRVKGPKMFAMASKGASPKVTYEQLVGWGYSLITMHCGMGGAIRGMRRTDVVEDETFTRMKRSAARITVLTKDGRMLSTEKERLTPLTDAEVRARFHDTCTDRIGAEKTAEVEELIENLEQLDSVRRIAELLA